MCDDAKATSFMKKKPDGGTNDHDRGRSKYVSTSLYVLKPIGRGDEPIYVFLWAKRWPSVLFCQAYSLVFCCSSTAGHQVRPH